MWAAGALRGVPESTTSDLAAGPGQHECRGQSGGAAADDHYVVFVHASRLARACRRSRQRTLLFPGNGAVQWARGRHGDERSLPRSTRSGPG